MYLLWKMEWHKIFYTRVSRDIINLWGKINYQYLLRQVFTSVVYDKVRNRKNYFEIPVYLLIEWGISMAGKFKVLLHFPAPEFACIFVFIWISGLFFKNQKGGTSKIIFPIPSYNPGVFIVLILINILGGESTNLFMCLNLLHLKAHSK